MPLSESIDSFGLFTQDVESMLWVVATLIPGWRHGPDDRKPSLAIPRGGFMQYLSPEAREAFHRQCGELEKARYTSRELRVPWDEDPEDIFHRMRDLLRGEMARSHREWYARFAALYGSDTTQAIHSGQTVSDVRLAALRADHRALRQKLGQCMDDAGVDLWVTPSSWGPAPEGFAVTGSSGMTGPWSYAGLPAISLPAGSAANGLPLGFQCVARWNDDERLLGWALDIEPIVNAA